jgi:hypothetical protein
VRACVCQLVSEKTLFLSLVVRLFVPLVLDDEQARSAWQAAAIVFVSVVQPENGNDNSHSRSICIINNCAHVNEILRYYGENFEKTVGTTIILLVRVSCRT